MKDLHVEGMGKVENTAHALLPRRITHKKIRPLFDVETGVVERPLNKEYGNVTNWKDSCVNRPKRALLHHHSRLS